MTNDDVVVLGSRRSREYRPDDLRLSMLSTPTVIGAIQAEFGFQQAQIGTPMATFGDVQTSLPPGVVFDVGSMVAKNEQPLAIRFMHFEFARIVVDIAGPSSYLDEVFEKLDRCVTSFRAPDGGPVIGPHWKVADQSDLSAHLSFEPTILLHPALSRLMTAGAWSTMEGDEVVPSISLQIQPTGAGFQPPRFASDQWMLQIRGGTEVANQQYFSSAPLASEEHISLLTDLDVALSPTSNPVRARPDSVS